MKQEIADMKEEIADMKLEKAGMKFEINMLIFGLQLFAASDDDIDSALAFQVILLQLVSINFFTFCHSIELLGLR